jgi:6-pyruvoyl-tetrahydropterin synthase
MENRRVYLTNLFSLECSYKNPEGEPKIKRCSFKLEVTVRKKIEHIGSGVDLESLKEVVDKNLVKRLEKQSLDDIIPMEAMCENLVDWIWHELEPYVELVNCELYKVGLWESPTSKIELAK